MNESKATEAEQSVVAEHRGGCLLLTLHNPPVNALSRALMVGLQSALARATTDPSVEAIVLTGGGSAFVAGADISRLEKLAQGKAPSAAPGELSLPELLAELENHRAPVVAAVDGFALGGGLELAMACSHRVATERSRLGLPELNLGLIPGAGGTQRLPRLVGVVEAAEMMLGKKPVTAARALELGLVDAVASDRDGLLERAVELGRELATAKRERRHTLKLTENLPSAEVAREQLDAARSKHRRLFKNVDYPELCLDALLTGVSDGAQAGLTRERQGFQRALTQPAAAGLIHLFFAERRAAKVPGVTDLGLSPRPIERVAVIGGGTMGSGITTALLNAGLRVQLLEVDEKAASAAQGRVESNLNHALKRGRSTEAQATERLSRLTAQGDQKDLADVQLVIEAATENLELKQKLLAGLLKHVSADCLIATNTSTIDVNQIGLGLGIDDRLLGLHFFSPAHIMRLVEVIRTESTSAQTLVDALALIKRLKKTAVTVGNCPGFLVNRVFMPYGQRVGFLIDRGVDPYRIDRVMVDFGMPMGPCRVSDLAGVDVGVFAGQILDQAYPERSYRSPLRKLLVEAGRKGEKSGLGHYRHEGRSAHEDPELRLFVTQARAEVGAPEPIEISDEEIVALLLSGIVSEACRAQEEGVVIRAADVDVAIKQGMGFPGYRGGPMKWADQYGLARVVALSDSWAERTGLGHFSVAPSLRAAADASDLLCS